MVEDGDNSNARLSWTTWFLMNASMMTSSVTRVQLGFFLVAVLLQETLTSYLRPSGGNWCPVMPPCFCDSGGLRQGRSKRIVCGELDTEFPKFLETNEVVDCVTLMYTGLKFVPAEAFANVKAVKIDLQGNNLGQHIADAAFKEAGTTVQDLNLSWSNITKLSYKVFRGMLELRNLSLAENSLRHLSHYSFQDLRNLERLSLAGNCLRHLPTTIFRYQTNLASLDLGYCWLEDLQVHLFAGLWNLHYLDLRGNRLTYLTPGIFEDLWSLKELLLSHNPITHVFAGTFRGLGNLERLELKESPLQYLESGVFIETNRLDYLDLGDNRLTSIGTGVMNIPSLEWLSLDGNDLVSLPKDIAYMTVLVYMDISYNNIRTLDRCIFERLRSLEYLNVRENPFHCNCDLYWLRTLQMRLVRHWHHSRVLPFVPAICASPDTMEGVGVTNWISLKCTQKNKHPKTCSYDHFWVK